MAKFANRDEEDPPLQVSIKKEATLCVNLQKPPLKNIASAGK